MNGSHDAPTNTGAELRRASSEASRLRLLAGGLPLLNRQERPPPTVVQRGCSRTAPHCCGAAMVDFRARVSEVFGSLEQASATGGWKLSQPRAFAPGREVDSSGSSDEEDRDSELEALPGAGMLDHEEHNDFVRRSSAQYCRQFEQEAEEDAFDKLATQGMRVQPDTDEMPCRSMEVLDDNPLDRLYYLRSHCAAPEEAQAATAVGVKRTSSLCLKGNERREKLSRLDASSKDPRSQVLPDHVRNPQNYRCYVLDAPVVVGSGETDDGCSLSHSNHEGHTGTGRDGVEGASTTDEGGKVIVQTGEGIAFRPQRRSDAAHAHNGQRTASLDCGSRKASVNDESKEPSVHHSLLAVDDDALRKEEQEETPGIGETYIMKRFARQYRRRANE